MKSRLRHPIRSLREPFGKAGLTVAVLALVLALVGGAYAAGGLTKSQEKQVTKIAKKYAGKPGAPGATGPAGPAGSAGAKGDPGNNGTSVTGVAIPTSSATCNHQGGTVYTSTSGAENVCNGLTGFTKTLPKGETEQGDWSLVAHTPGTGLLEGSVATAIGFNIPLASAPTAVYVGEASSAEGTGDLTNGSREVTNVTGGAFTKDSVITGAGIPAETRIEKVEITGNLKLTQSATATSTGVHLTTALPEGCTGSVAEPGAEQGNLCVFAATEVNNHNALPSVCSAATSVFQCVSNAGSNPAADPFGAIVAAEAESAALPIALAGSWAVTAE